MYDLLTIAEKIGAYETTIRKNEPIEHILTDSRLLIDPQHTLFFAFRTNTGNGHKYIASLYQHGVRNFVVDAEEEVDERLIPKANVLYTHDTLKAIQRLAAAWRGEFTMPVVAITGSNGKTVTKEFAYQLFSQKYNIVRSPRSFNSQLGVPLSVLKMRKEDEMAIFEAGISQPAEMERLAHILDPTYGIFTNIGSAHQENFTDVEEKIDEKMLLFTGCKAIVYNGDCEEIAEGIARAHLQGKSYTWSMKRRDAHLFVEKIETFEERSLLHIEIAQEKHLLEIPFTDQASIEDILHCIVLGIAIDSSLLPTLIERAAHIEPVKMRMEVKEGNNDNIIINDTYSNDLNSLEIALEFLRQRATKNHLHKVIVLSDIRQSALTPKTLYRGIAEKIKKYDCDLFIGVGRELMRHNDFFEETPTHFFPSSEALLASDIFDRMKESAILVKGARSYKFEQLVARIARKSNETTLEVNLLNMIENFRHYKRLLPRETKIMAMVKANAYGTGAYETARALEDAGVDMLAVAVADEGKELRKGGISVPIMVMDPGVSDIDMLIDHNLEPVVHSFQQFERIKKRIDKEGFDAFPIHIELDTGMHRLGFRPDEAAQLARCIRAQNILVVKSIFTHLAAAEDPNEDLFTKTQINRYEKACQTIAQQLGYNPIRHVLNTAGIERFTSHAFDMVRLGIGLYGVSAVASTALQPVIRLHSTLLQISNINPGESIGYNRRGLLPKGGRIGIIPIGYADGYDRRFGCGVGKVVIRGKVYPTIGSICMDTCMIDLSNDADNEVREGDEVTILGAEKGITLSEQAQAIGTIAYELIADLASRIKRVYIR